MKRTAPKQTKRDEPRSLPLWLTVVAQAAAERSEQLKQQAKETGK